MNEAGNHSFGDHAHRHGDAFPGMREGSNRGARCAIADAAIPTRRHGADACDFSVLEGAMSSASFWNRNFSKTVFSLSAQFWCDDHSFPIDFYCMARHD
ncbi:hypothetical protein [Burkholderia mayonis]|uniref:hypothetical protein n=1 Tax=Burkholderia mayonis TaxID=1385591 RepID=UPI00131EDFDC|nr:hypothetical protein [Burkholderia mayonis]